MSQSPETKGSTPGWIPPLTDEDVAAAGVLVQQHAGSQTSVARLGARARGTKGDGPFYAETLVISDPTIADKSDQWDEYLENLGEAARQIGNTVARAGNVGLDITGLKKSP